MAHFDLPLADLRNYHPTIAEPADFDAFWRTVLAELAQIPLAVQVDPWTAVLPMLDVEDVTFAGDGGAPIKAWLLCPKLVAKPQPCVVEYVAYGGGRGHPLDWLFWPMAGFACLVMDNRGQGGDWLGGQTPDQSSQGYAPHHPGVFTLGLKRPSQYYYRRLFADATRAVDVARTHPAIDPTRIAVSGFSQGAGVALAVAGLRTDIAALLTDMPFLCHMQRAITLTDELPYAELTAYLRLYGEQEEQALATLAYFDGVSFARRATAPALFATGLMDTVCPPSTVFAAYNAYAGRKEMRVFPYHAHQPGGSAHRLQQIAFLQAHFAR